MGPAHFPPILDGHNDALLSLHAPERGQGRDFFVRSTRGHVDLPRAQEGGLGAAFFAVFVPPEAPPVDDLTITATGYE
ncbi:MAG: membrane dipeptidase, partial [Chloroflexota bacterium]